MAEHQNIVGPVIRKIRAKKGLTQAQLVTKLNLAGWDLSRGTFAKIESQVRCVTDYELMKFAEVLGVELDDLFK